MPAQRLESFVPAMKRKGRLQPGMDAHIVLFDPAMVGTRATYGDAARYSGCFRYVMVHGLLVIRSEERRVGKACVSKFRSRWSPYHKKKKKNTLTLEDTYKQ